MISPALATDSSLASDADRPRGATSLSRINRQRSSAAVLSNWANLKMRRHNLVVVNDEMMEIRKSDRDNQTWENYDATAMASMIPT